VAVINDNCDKSLRLGIAWPVHRIGSIDRQVGRRCPWNRSIVIGLRQQNRFACAVAEGSKIERRFPL
jgi:hypothetical protein